MITTTTNVFTRNLEAYYNRSIRRAVNQGGTSSSKTFSIVQLLIFIATYSKQPIIISVVSESVPHLKRGVMRDFAKIMGDNFQDKQWNKTDSIYTFSNNVQIEFFSADNASKLRGGRRDILYINECNNVSYEGYMELDIRTRLFTFLDYNPVAEFWAHEKVLPYDENQFIHSTYLDALHVLEPLVVKNIESNKIKDPNWWNVYGLGYVGKIEGLVHPNFKTIDEMPTFTGIETFGLDFGYTNDPTSFTWNIIKDDCIYSDELIYQPGLTNQDIARKFTELGVVIGYDEIFADSSEPKSIEEIARYGFNIKPVQKGPDSVMNGIQRVNQFKQHWTKRSVPSIKEQRNYRYIEDKFGKLTNKPSDSHNHSMDSRRYAVVGKLGIESGSFHESQRPEIYSRR